MAKRRKKKPVTKKRKKIVRRRVVAKKKRPARKAATKRKAGRVDVAPAASVAEPPFHPLPPVSGPQEGDLALGSDVPTNEGRE